MKMERVAESVVVEEGGLLLVAVVEIAIQSCWWFQSAVFDLPVLWFQ